MRRKNKTPRAVMRKQTAACFLLMIVLFALSFGSLYSVKVQVTDNVQTALDKMVDIINEVSISSGDGEQEEFIFELPEKVDVNLWVFAGMVFKIGDVVEVFNGVLELANAYQSGDSNLQYQAIGNLEGVLNSTKELISSEAFINAVALIVSVMASFSESAVAGVIMVIMVAMTVVLPTAIFLHLTVAAIGWLFRVANAEKSYAWMNKCYKSLSRVFLMILTVLLLDIRIGLAWGVIVSLCVCALGYVISVTASYKKNRTEIGRKYINVVLATAGIKLCGFAMFYICLARSGILGQYVAIIVKDIIPNIFSKAYGTEYLKQYASVMLAILAIFALISALLTVVGTLARAGGMVQRNKELCLFSTVMTMVLIFVPVIVSTFDTRIVLEGKIAMLVLSFVGTLIMLGSEIALPICRKKFCIGLKESEKDAILRGLETVETEAYEPEEE